MADADKKVPAEGTDQLPPHNPPGYFEGESMTRRKVFAIGGQALGGLAIAIPGLAVLGFSAAPIFETPNERWQSVGPLEDYGPDTYTQSVITEVDGIGEAGKQTVYVRQGNPEVFEGESADEYIAVSNRCAHLGCPVRFVKAAGNFICPCHGGIYDFEGKVAGGPPVRPLDRFQTRVNGDQLEIGPRFSVTSDLEPVRSRDPGQFTGGIWEYLYPPRPSTPPAP